MDKLPQVRLRSHTTCRYPFNTLHLHCNLETADNASSIIIEGIVIGIEIFQKAIAECGIKSFVIVTTDAGWGGGADIILALRVPLIANDEDTMVLHSRHPLDVFFTDGGQYIKGAGIMSSQIRFIFELPATREGINPNRVVLEEHGGHES